MVLTKIYNIILSIIFPEFCCGCSQRGSLLCYSCHEKLSYLTMPVAVNLTDQYFETAYAALDYDSFTKKIVAELKYKSVIAVGRLCGVLIYQTVNLPKADLITAVPLHPIRQRIRGFNQAEIIAKSLAEKMAIPYCQYLERSINTPPQAKQTSREHRLQALKTVFTFYGNPKRVSGKSIIIVDDVITTGTTINECSNVLINVGCKKVFAVALAGR